MTQLQLLPPATRCGYCNRELAVQPEGDYKCPRCAPLLDQVHTADEWIAFHAEAMTDRVAT